jgi:hypothetical protein
MANLLDRLRLRSGLRDTRRETRVTRRGDDDVQLRELHGGVDGRAGGRLDEVWSLGHRIAFMHESAERPTRGLARELLPCVTVLRDSHGLWGRYGRG